MSAPAIPTPRAIRPLRIACGHCSRRHATTRDVRTCSKAVGYRRWLARQEGK